MSNQQPSDEQPNYECKITAKLCRGNYTWCGNEFAPRGYGFTLKLPSDDNKQNDHLEHKQYLIQLNIKINPVLLRDAEFYDIYDSTGFLTNYSTKELKEEMKPRWVFADNLIGTKLEIVFSKKKQILSEKEKYIINSEYGRYNGRLYCEQLFKINISIPNLKQYGDTKDCAICLQNVSNETDKYISPCGHLFHLGCIFQYLEHNNKLYPLVQRCRNTWCCGARKVKPFECPVCKSMIDI